MKKIHFVHTLGMGIFFIKSSKILYMFTDAGLALASLESKCRASSIRPCSTKTSTCKIHPSVSTTPCKATKYPGKYQRVILTCDLGKLSGVKMLKL